MSSVTKVDYFDEDIHPLLSKASDSDLAPLVGFIEKKISEALTTSVAYRKHSPYHSKYADLIASEVKLMGGNTISNKFRSNVGPSYYSIVCDVAERVKAPFKPLDEISIIEKSILETIFKTSLSKMTDIERNELLKVIKSGGVDIKGISASSLVALFEAGGFYSYQLAVIAANQAANLVLGHGLSFAANAALTKGLSVIAGPVGWTACGAWTLFDITSPAYSVTIPCVAHIAYLRIQSKLPRCSNCSVVMAKNNDTDLCLSCLSSLSILSRFKARLQKTLSLDTANLELIKERKQANASHRREKKNRLSAVNNKFKAKLNNLASGK